LVAPAVNSIMRSLMVRTIETRFGPCRVMMREANGAAPIALLLHGSGGRAEIWSPVTGIFREVAPVAIEMPGHGESRLPLLSSVEDHVFLVEDVRAALAIETCVVVGHSLGGAIAIQYARDFPQRCHAVVAASAGPNFIVDFDRIAALEVSWESSIEHFARGQVSPDAAPDVLARARTVVRARDPKVLAHDLRICNAFDASGWLAKVATPTLVICAYEDPLTPLDGSLVLARQIARAVLTVIGPGGHSLMLEHPIRFARAIDAFIESLRTR